MLKYLRQINNELNQKNRSRNPKDSCPGASGGKSCLKQMECIPCTSIAKEIIENKSICLLDFLISMSYIAVNCSY